MAKQFLDASGLNQYTQALKNGTLIVGKAAEASHATTADATGLIGIVPLENLPEGALDRLIQVANKAARLALTSSQVQLGDTVQELDTKKMFIVIDESALGTEAAFVEYTAGRATFAQDASHADVATKAVDASTAKVAYEVAWDDITGVPGEFKPAAHTHGAADVSTLTGYQKAETAADVAAADSLLTALGKIEKKADDAAKSAGFHTQDGSTIVGLDGYNGPAAEYDYVTSNDSLESALAKIEKKALDSSNTADWGSITNKPTTYDASIVMMGGYEKKSGDVAATDSALVAVGKVEKKVDDVTAAFEGHTHGAADVSTMAGYTGPAASYSAVVAGDTLNRAIAKIEKKALDSSNSADWDNIVDKPSVFTPEDHAATKVTSLGTYSKAGSVEDVAAGDSLVVALGKIEKKADDAADAPIPAATIDKIVNGTY
jgi:hypothetical protein